jgi:large subunit ribosomal protein L3
VTQVATRDRRLQRHPVGCGEIEAARSTSPRRALRRPAHPRRHSSRSAPRDRVVHLGQELSAELFTAGEEIDVTGTSKGKGFAGVIIWAWVP